MQIISRSRKKFLSLVWLSSSVLFLVTLRVYSYPHANLSTEAEHQRNQPLTCPQVHSDESNIVQDPTVLTCSLYKSGHALTPNICKDTGRAISLLVILTSSAADFSRRKAVRSTWTQIDDAYDAVVTFIIGQTSSKEDQEMIEDESDQYGDLLQGNFEDTYENLPLKTISMLEWIDASCPTAKLILKADDDVFINYKTLWRTISGLEHVPRSIFGKLGHGWKPARNTDSKYYIPFSAFGGDIFPDFVFGPAYILSADIVPELYHESLSSPFMKLEDVFLTGIVADKLGISRRNIDGFLTDGVSAKFCQLQAVNAIHGVRASQMYSIMRKFAENVNTTCAES